MRKFSHGEDRQLKSAALTQIELPISRRARSACVPREVIAVQPTKIAAIKLCIQASGLEEKEVCSALDIDSGHFARMMSGQAYFPNNKEHALMDLCGNEIPLEWDALRRNKELKPLRSDLEQRLEDVLRENEELRKERDITIRLWKETRG
jgi:hypothetical protein